jgi:hypothetical protein
LSLPSSALSSPASWHRLFVSGSDRSCEKWMADYRIAGIEELQPTRSPNQPRTPARKDGVLDLRKWMRPRDRLSLEEAGFEPSVPQAKVSSVFRAMQAKRPEDSCIHFGAGAAVQLDLFCPASHSMERMAHVDWVG